eukprot:SAG31_NODE_429_length_15801_cov_6.878551_5_plen_267_part_00
MPPLKSSAAPDGDGDEASGQTEDVARPTHQPGSIKRIKSIGQDLGSSRITGLDPTAGFSGWHALKFDVVVALACCAVMKVVPRVSKLPSSYESVLRRILYLSLGLRVALPAVYDVVRYQWRLITGKWQDDKTLHGCGLSVIGTGKWFRIMMISDILMRATMVNASLAPDLLAHHIVYYCFAWFGVHMSSKGEEWRDCIISGGWQVLACEAMGAANGLVLLLRPADISRWMRITTVATILGIRTPVHASVTAFVLLPSVFYYGCSGV